MLKMSVGVNGAVYHEDDHDRMSLPRFEALIMGKFTWVADGGLPLQPLHLILI